MISRTLNGEKDEDLNIEKKDEKMSFRVKNSKQKDVALMISKRSTNTQSEMTNVEQ